MSGADIPLGEKEKMESPSAESKVQASDLALFIAIDKSFCLDLEILVILLGIIFPFSLTYLDNNLISL